MNNIVVVYEPFDKFQRVTLYENGEATHQTFVDSDDIVDTINGFTNLCSNCVVNLVGNEQMLCRFKQGLMTKFSQENKIIEIKITNK